MDTKITKNGYLKIDLGYSYMIFSGEDDPIVRVMVATKIDKNEWQKTFISPTLYLKNIPKAVEKHVGKDDLKKIKATVKPYLNKHGYLPKDNLEALQRDLEKL